MWDYEIKKIARLNARQKGGRSLEEKQVFEKIKT